MVSGFVAAYYDYPTACMILIVVGMLLIASADIEKPSDKTHLFYSATTNEILALTEMAKANQIISSYIAKICGQGREINELEYINISRYDRESKASSNQELAVEKLKSIVGAR